MTLTRSEIEHYRQDLLLCFYKEENIRAINALCDQALLGLAEGKVMISQDVMDKIESWSKAYPLDIFPEPDFAKARELLAAGGITIDAVSASNMRHVITRVWEMLAASEAKP